MNRRKKQNDARAFGWILTLLIVFEVVYFTVVSPEALSPTFVTILTALLITARAAYGIGANDDEEDSSGTAGGVRNVAAKVAKRALGKVADSERDPYDQQDTDRMRRAWGILRRDDRAPC
jgi:hypothetical protein